MRTVLLLLAAVSAAEAADFVASPRADVREAIRRGREEMVREYRKNAPSYQVLLAYAMLKSGSDESDPIVSGMIDRIIDRVKKKQFTGRAVGHRMYEAGLEAMILADSGGDRFKPELEVIRDYIIDNQQRDGSWSYAPGVSDVSVTQYAVLGLWAAERSGAEVPVGIWSKVGKFFLKAQERDGGYPYKAFGGGPTTLSMTAAGVGSMAIAQMHLPKTRAAASRSVAEEAVGDGVEERLGTTRYGFLRPVDEEAEREAERRASEEASKPKREKKDEPDDEGPALEAGTLDSAIERANGYLNRRFAYLNDNRSHRPYWYYTLERCASLSNQETYRGLDWYDALADELLKEQEPSGRWDMRSHYPGTGATAFVVLFLSRPTAKFSKPRTADPRLAGGLLAGGRGLPKDLSRFGEPEEKERTPLEQLLSDLSTAGGTELPDVQQRFVEQVRLGDRDALVGHADELAKLAKNSDPQIRRTVLWAIGRTGELSLARFPLEALDDDSLAVLTEARNALAWISRDPGALGFPQDPLTGVPEGASFAERTRAVETWRSGMIDAWGRWYLAQSPYGDRFDEFELDLRRRLGRK